MTLTKQNTLIISDAVRGPDINYHVCRGRSLKKVKRLACLPACLPIQGGKKEDAHIKENRRKSTNNTFWEKMSTDSKMEVRAVYGENVTLDLISRIADVSQN